MDTLNTSKQLFELLKEGVDPKGGDIDYSELKYVVYARKSTTGDERQERSIPDQIKDCKDKIVDVDHVDSNGNKYRLNVSKRFIKEKCSAKDPGIREKFDQLIQDVKDGKVDGIICWHPDRLSRNMKEAGEIIDLLDKGILKDLRFATSTFENSPTGKMLLGISFVLSKQYSEHLSESVARGNRRKIEEGVFIGRFKHGYRMNKQGQLHPDGDNWAIIKKAFDKRLTGETQQSIAEWFNATGYQVFKRIKDKDKNSGFKHDDYVWGKDTVSDLLKDPIYAGVLKYGDYLCDLEEFYDFSPVISVEDFLKINKVDDLNSSKLVSSIMSKDKRVTKASLLNGMVYCGFCDKPFSSGLTPKTLASKERIHYYYYRCETEHCQFKNKSFRANIVLDYSYAFLGEHLFTTQSNYDKFKLGARDQVIQRNKEARSLIGSARRGIGRKKEELRSTKELIRNNPELKEDYDLKEIKSELGAMKPLYSPLRTQFCPMTNISNYSNSYLLNYQKPKISSYSIMYSESSSRTTV
jgi:DNA invertase Pin-like site-specific DNA recombinase